MDCFAVSITNSSISGLVKPGIPLKTALVFSLSHFLLTWIGFWLGGLLAPLVVGIEAWVAFMVFSIIGFKMIYEAMRRHPQAKVFDINRLGVILALSLATSMDAFLAGVVIGILAGPVWLASVLFAITVFIFTLSGLAGGKGLGLIFAKRTAIFGGAFMVFAAFWFLSLVWR